MTNDPSIFSGVTESDLTVMGAALMNAISTTMTLGHDRPSNTLDYLPPKPGGDWRTEFVLDFTAWASGRNVRPGAADRVKQVLLDTDWQRAHLTALTERLAGDDPK